MTKRSASTSLGRRALLGGAAAAAGAVLLDGTPAGAAPVAALPPRPDAMPATGPLDFYMLDSPVRVYDSRPGQPPDGTDLFTEATDQRLVRNTTVTLDITTVLGGLIVMSAYYTKAAVITLTAVQTLGANGYLKVWPYGGPEPLVSHLNWWSPGSTVANTVLTKVESGMVHIRCGGATSASTHLIVDVVGFYQLPSV